jgi:hypothetical protein
MAGVSIIFHVYVRFDLLLCLNSGSKVFVEVKFTEVNFGAAAPDESHRRKLKELYRPRLAGKIVPAFLEEAKFFPYYQLFRNISHGRPNIDTIVFVVPAHNGAAIKHAEVVLKSAVIPGKIEVRLVTVESVVACIRNVIAQIPFIEHDI